MEYLGVLLCLCMETLLLFLLLTRYVNNTNAEVVMLPLSHRQVGNDVVTNQFVFNLALQVDELRQQQQSHADIKKRDEFNEGLTQGSLEVVDTILALHGFDPHPPDESDTVVSLDDFVRR